jgi:ribose 5-phosphate isomerase B
LVASGLSFVVRRALFRFEVRCSSCIVRGSLNDERRTPNPARRTSHDERRTTSNSVQSLAVRIAIGADHAGFALKEHLKQTLARLGHAVDDHGTHSDASVDYPPICAAVGRAVTSGAADRGIVLGGSGQGEQIAANKVIGVRAALCNDLYTARLSREHNDANVLAMGGRVVAFGLADEILTLWLATAFEGGRHQRRIDQISEAERSRP